MFKTFVICMVLAAIAGVDSASGAAKQIENKMKQCAKETNTPEDPSLVNGLPQSIDDSKACLYVCIAKKFKVVKGDNSFDTNSMIIKMVGDKKKNLKTVVSNCNAKNNQGVLCVKTANRMLCAAKEVIPAQYFQK